jgi:drug/metabolite transporter (DMT)-like permease
MIGAAISWAIGTVLLKYFHWTMPTATLRGWLLIIGGIPVIFGFLTIEHIKELHPLSWKSAMALTYIIILPMNFCHWAWTKVIQLLPANLAALGTLAVPVIGVFSSALVLGEKVGSKEFAALFFVIMALTMVLFRVNK